MPRRAGFTIIEVLVVISILTILAAFLVVAVGTVRRTAFEEKTVALLRGLESGIQEYVTRHAVPPPLAGAAPPADPGDIFGTAGPFGGTNYRNSAYLHFYLGSEGRKLGPRDGAGNPTFVQPVPPLHPFAKSDVSTWSALDMATFGDPAARYDSSTGAVKNPGFVLDAWGRAIAYVPMAAGQGRHDQAAPAGASNPRDGLRKAASGRNLAGFVQLWSKGANGETSLPGSGAAPANAGSNAADPGGEPNDDLVNWFLPYY